MATLFLLKLVVTTALRFVYPFLPTIARGLGIDLTQAGALVSVRSAAGLATPLVLTAAGKTHRSRRMVVAGLVLFATGAVVTAWTGVFVGAVVGFALLGLAKPLIDISSQVYVSERVSYEDRARYLGILELSWAGGLLLGAPVAAWLIENWSWEAPFWVVGTLGFLCIGLAMRYLDPDDKVANRAPKAEDSPGPQVVLVLTTVVLFGFANESILITLGGWLEGTFGMTLLALGGVGTLLALSELAGEGAMVAFTDRIGKRNSLALGLGIAAAALFALALVSDELVPAMITLVVTMVSLEFGFISGIPLMTELRPRSRTRVLSLAVVATGVGRIAGDLIAPRVFAAAGMQVVAAMAAVVTVGALMVVVVGVKEVDPKERVRSQLGE